MPTRRFSHEDIKRVTKQMLYGRGHFQTLDLDQSLSQAQTPTITIHSNNSS